MHLISRADALAHPVRTTRGSIVIALEPGLKDIVKMLVVTRRLSEAIPADERYSGKQRS